MKKLLLNRWFHFLVLLVLLFAASAGNDSENPWRMKLQYAMFDKYNNLHPRETPPDHPVIVVDIDEESLERLGQWPWPRSVLAKMVENLAAMDARVTAFDVVFGEPDRTSPERIIQGLPETEDYRSVREKISDLPDNDLIFGDAIKNAGNVVMGYTMAGAADTRRPPLVVKPIQAPKGEKDLFFAKARRMWGVATNLPQIDKSAAGSGSFMAVPDTDGIIRKISLIFGGDFRPSRANIYPSLNLEALRIATAGQDGVLRLSRNKVLGMFDSEFTLEIGKYGPSGFEPKYRVPVETDGVFWVHFRNIDKKKEYISAYKILDPAFHDEVASRIKDKIVFVGASPEGLRDVRSTPLGLYIPGVEVHVNVVEQIMQGDFILRSNFIKSIENYGIFFVGLLIVLLTPFAGIFVTGAMSGAFIAGIFFAAWHAYINTGLLFDPIYASLCIGFLFVASTLLTYIRTELERKHIREAFGLYISPDFMKELTSSPDKLKLGGETRELTVMFTDIRGFTGIAEHMKPEELIQLMNDFLTPMSDLVMSHRGTIDKYMGDAMMAFWNAPLDDPDHARHACMAAVRMNKALDPINDDLRAKAEAAGRPPLLLKAGIGLNTGPASVGNMGSRQRFAYSAIGDTVNLASRLEGQTKTYSASILISEETRRRIPDFATLELDLLQVKGRTLPARVFALLGDEEYARPDAFRTWQKVHEAMIASYRGREFGEAERLLAESRELAAGRLQNLYSLYAERVAELKKNPPDASWDGVFIAAGK